MKVSRPQFLVYPVEKCGKPAERDTQNCAVLPSSSSSNFGVGSAKLGESRGKRADFIKAPNCTDPNDRAFTNDEPFPIKLKLFR